MKSLPVNPLRWLVCLAGALLLQNSGTTSALAAETETAPTPTPYQTNFWKKEWPPMSAKELRVRSITNILFEGSTLKFTMRFYDWSSPRYGGRVIEEVLKVEVLNKLTGNPYPATFLSSSPAKVMAETNHAYRLSYELETSRIPPGTTLTLKVATIFGEKLAQYFGENQAWCEERIEVMQEHLGTNLPTALNDQFVRQQNLLAQDMKISSIKGILRPLETGLKAPLQDANFLAELRTNDCWPLLTNIMARKFQNDSNDCVLAFLDQHTSTNAVGLLTNDVNKASFIFQALMLRQFVSALQTKGHTTSESADGKSNASSDKPAEAADTPPFPGSGRIGGFLTFVEKIEQLPYKQVASNLGQGIANHFSVFRVTFLNTATNSVMLYGEQIKFLCRANAFSYKNPSSYRRLLVKVPEESFLIRTNKANGVYWRGKFISKAKGGVEELPQELTFRPIPLSFMIRGYEDREFHTIQAGIYRTMDTVADVSTALIPFGNAYTWGKDYAAGAGIFSGIFIPSARKLFGNSTEVQKQAFLLESMPQYVELEVGQSLSKLVYFPRHGYDKMVKDRVMFISEFGKAHEMSVQAAILIKPKEEREKPQ